MIRKTVDMLMIRWPEVLLVVVLQTVLLMFSDELMMMAEATGKTGAQMPFWANFLMGTGTMVVVTVWQMLYLGFLKTAAISGNRPCQPMELLLRGRPYFWRILFFQLLFGLVVLTVGSLVMGLLAQLVWKTDDVTKVPQWASQTCAMLVLAAFIKPMVFIPARMVVYNSTVMQAWAAMARYRLGEMRSVYPVIAGGFSGVIALMLLSLLAEEKSVVYYICSILYHGLFSVLLLTLTLLAVLWVQAILTDEQTPQENA